MSCNCVWQWSEPDKVEQHLPIRTLGGIPDIVALALVG
jgi:hypothetical protein